MKNNTKYSDTEYLILNEITGFCNYDCGNKLNCAEEECVLFRIEKMVSKK